MGRLRARHPGGARRPTTEPPILILGLAGLAMHHGALGVIRSAGRMGVPVFHAHPGGRCALDSSRYSAGRVGLPSDGGEEGTLAALLEFAARRPGAVLLAVDDAGAIFVDRHGGALARAFRLPAQPSGLARALADKRGMQRLCREHGVPTPLASFPESEAEALAHADVAAFPVVAKRIDASLGIDSATPNVLIARDREELVGAYRALASPLAPNVMLQEYIPGSGEVNWMFNGYFDGDSRCRASFTGVKIRQAPPEAGATSLGVCRVSQEIAGTTERFLGAIGYRGIVDADYRFDRRDGRCKLLDLNPRIGCSFRLFLGTGRIDVLRAMYLDLTGRPVPDGVTQRERRRWIVEPQDLRFARTHLRSGVTVREWLGSLRHVEEAAWWARDDPAPLLALSATLLATRARRAMGGRRSSAHASTGGVGSTEGIGGAEDAESAGDVGSAEW